MNDYFQENRRALLILSILLLVLAIVLYFILIRPLSIDLDRKKNSITSIEADIELLKAELENIDDDLQEIDIEKLKLENKIPPKPDIDEYILSLQQLEFTTKSKIESIDFTYDSNLEVITNIDEESSEDEDEKGIQVEQLDEEDIEIDINEDEEETMENESSIDQDMLNEKPEELHVITVKVIAISADFDNFLDLLQEIEDNERISVITNLTFTKPAENNDYFAENPLEVIPFEIELTTFYYGN